MKKNFIYCLKIVLPLVVICLMTVGMISAVNYFTAPVIEQNKKNTFDATLGTLFGIAEGDKLTAEQLPPQQHGLDPALIKAAYRIYINDAPAGFCFDTIGQGAYKGTIEMLVAVDTEGRVLDLSCIRQTETPGKGDAVLNDSFYEEHYSGKTFEQLAEKNAVIAGSTKTSTALKNAVDNALKAYETLLSKEDAPNEN